VTIHTLYAGAQLYRADSLAKIRAVAETTLDNYESALAVSMDSTWIRNRLRTEPVQDQRIDFEDGYGPRGDHEEDAHASTVACMLAEAIRAGAVPASIGIRVKAFTNTTRARAKRTLERFFGAFGETQCALPQPFIVTLPKVTLGTEVSEFRDCVDACTQQAGLPGDHIRFELMVEHPAALAADALERWVALLGDRGHAIHLGAYDLLSEYGVAAPSQSLLHPLLDHARGVMLRAAHGKRLLVVDGATNVLPIAPHKMPQNSAETLENEETMRRAFRLHHAHVLHALSFGIRQGWDLHPAQIVARLAALHSYYTNHWDVMVARRAQFHSQRQQATRVGAMFDDAATARGLECFFEQARELDLNSA
jgi:hypothetical protein